MANRIKRKLAQQITERLAEFGPVADSLKTVRRADEFAVRLYTGDLSLARGVSEISKDLEGLERFESKNAGEYRNIKFHMDQNHVIRNVLEEALNPSVDSETAREKIIVEFSSPNIAKPFHVGHLRSTIIGNFLANINAYTNNRVTRLNYLGDWGTQFGMLKIGVDLCKIKAEDIRNDPIQGLYRAYVKANQLAEKDNSIYVRARQIFNALEKGDPSLSDEWNTYRKASMDELKITYNRINVNFDEYHWESMYNSNVTAHIMESLEAKGVIRTHDDGKKVAILNGKEVIVSKSDGSSLYLSRDVAAAHDRLAKYNFDKMLYVVDNSQIGHFNSLFDIFKQMESPLFEKCQHVKFGRIKGMSTRKGTSLFLNDILDEAMYRMNERRQISKTTKGKYNDESIADVLGTTSLIIYDLKRKRTKDYEFSWDKALNDIGDSASKLQYTYCRLKNIEENCNVELPLSCNPSLIQTPEALELIKTLAWFDDIIKESQKEMEACILVKYLFSLCNATNKAVSKLRVKDQPIDIAEQRLLLFHSARLTLKRGLEILGIKPLTKM